MSDLRQVRQLTNGSYGRNDGFWGLDWTPDGRLIYTTSDTVSQFLSAIDVQAGTSTVLTGAGHIDSVLTVSFDGKYILFHSNRGGGFDIWRANIDGSDMVQLTKGGKNHHPAPSPDGKWVYYKTFMDNVGALCRVPMAGGNSECLTDHETSWPSFSPDGKFIAAAYKTDKSRLAILSAESHEILKQFDLPASSTTFMGIKWLPDSSGVVIRDRNEGYWIQPVDGRPPSKMNGMPQERLYNFAFSRDGRSIAYIRGQEIRDVVLMSDVR